MFKFVTIFLIAAGLLTRDPRNRERKKPGQKKARKKFTWYTLTVHKKIKTTFSAHPGIVRHAVCATVTTKNINNNNNNEIYL